MTGIEWYVYLGTMWAFGGALVVAAFAGWVLDLAVDSQTTAEKITRWVLTSTAVIAILAAFTVTGIDIASTVNW
jgi:hypothetical protein